MPFEIFLATAPGLEHALFEEVKGKGFKKVQQVRGGVTVLGDWPDVWRANLWIRGASRVLARIASFRVLHLAQLDMRAREVEWGALLDASLPFNVEVSCKKSKIYHSDAAAERISRAITETIKAPYSKNADIKIMARIERDICTLSVDTSGELLHKRGFKSSVNKAPMRENMASLFLQKCGYKGDEPIYDPMCGSGTFVIEAAEIAARLNPGRARHFAFEKLLTFEQTAWEAMRSVRRQSKNDFKFYGSDRDEGAVKMSEENARRAAVNDITDFKTCSISEITPPTETPGLIIVNPPYGGRIGDEGKLKPLYQSFGKVLKERFSGWRAGIITTSAVLAHATELSFSENSEPVQHGGLRVMLYQTGPL